MLHIFCFLFFMSSSAYAMLPYTNYKNYKLVDLAKVDSSIKILSHLKSGSNKAYMLKNVAKALSKVQARMKISGFELLIIEAYRPASKKAEINETALINTNHNCHHSTGASVDVVMNPINSNPNLQFKIFELMKRGTEPDNLAELNDFLLAYNGLIEALKNSYRKLLEFFMSSEGFINDPSDWSHFDAPHAAVYPNFEMSFDDLENLDDELMNL